MGSEFYFLSLPLSFSCLLAGKKGVKFFFYICCKYCKRCLCLCVFNLKLANQGKRNHHHHHHQMTKDDDHRNRNRKRTHTNLVFFSHFENYIWYITTVINLKLIKKIVWLCVCVCMLVNSVVVDGSYVFFFQ